MRDNHFAGVGGIVLRDGQVLLVRHTYGSAAGKLLNPGGFIHVGELPADAIKREIFEETGVRVEPTGMLAIRCSHKDWYMVFAADYLDGEPASDAGENSEALFMEVAEALRRPDVTDTAKTLIRLALEREPLAQIDADRGRVMFAAGRG